MRVLCVYLLSLLVSACVSTDGLQLSNGRGKSFAVYGASYEKVWQAAVFAMRQDMEIVESHKPSGVIKSRVVKGTAGKVVGFFIQPTDETAPQYTITVVSRKPFQTDLVDRDWEPSVVEDFKTALGK